MAAPNKSAQVVKQMPKSIDLTLTVMRYLILRSVPMKLVSEKQGIHLDDKDLQRAALFKKMSAAYSLSTVFLKDKNLTTKKLLKLVNI